MSTIVEFSTVIEEVVDESGGSFDNESERVHFELVLKPVTMRSKR